MSKRHHTSIAVVFLSLCFSASASALQLVQQPVLQTLNSPDAQEISGQITVPALSTLKPASVPVWMDSPDATPARLQQAVATGRIDAETADLYLAFALRGDDRLPREYISTATWHGTAHLARLRQTTLAQLKWADADPSRQMLASTDVYMRIEQLLNGFCYDYTSALTNEFDSPHFHIQYSTIGGGLTIQDYATSLERAWDTEVVKFGWPQPPIATAPAAGNRIHVRIDLTKQQGLYGLASYLGTHAGRVGDNPNTAWRETDAEAACLVLNRDFSKFYPTSALQALNATTAHEFVHVIHYGVGIDSDLNGNAGLTFAESMATMMEDEVMNEANDNYNYLWPKLDICLGAYNDSPYKYWVVMRAMTERFGTGVANGAEQVLQDFMTVLSQGQGGRLTAFNQGFVNKGTTLANAYHDAAITLRFTKPCDGNYVYPYCFSEANNYVQQKGAAKISSGSAVNGTISTLGGSYSGTVENHYAMNWVDLPLNIAPYAVTLQNNSTTGEMRFSVVCDTGSALNVLTPSQVVSAKKSGAVPNVDPSACVKLTAIITNQKVTSEAPRTCSADAYTLSIGAPSSLFKTYLSFVRK